MARRHKGPGFRKMVKAVTRRRRHHNNKGNEMKLNKDSYDGTRPRAGVRRYVPYPVSRELASESLVRLRKGNMIDGRERYLSRILKDITTVLDYLMPDE